MRNRSSAGTVAAALLVVGGCKPAPPPEPPAPEPVREAFAYVPQEAPLSYTLADSVTMEFQGGMLDNVRVEGGYFAKVALTQEDTGSGIRVRARLADFTGELRNPMAGTTRATEEDARGEWVLLLQPSGEAVTESCPDVADDLGAVLGSADLLRSFFLHLPEGAVRMDRSWTDTVTVQGAGVCDRSTDREETSTSIMTSTWTGDTLVAGRTLRVIDTTTRTTLTVRVESDGMRVLQELQGTTTATSLWDPYRGVLVRTEERGTLSGSLDVPAAGIAEAPFTATVRRVLVLER